MAVLLAIQIRRMQRRTLSKFFCGVICDADPLSRKMGVVKMRRQQVSVLHFKS
jgi:hypothetical protein